MGVQLLGQHYIITPPPSRAQEAVTLGSPFTPSFPSILGIFARTPKISEFPDAIASHIPPMVTTDASAGREYHEFTRCTTNEAYTGQVRNKEIIDS